MLENLVMTVPLEANTGAASTRKNFGIRFQTPKALFGICWAICMAVTREIEGSTHGAGNTLLAWVQNHARKNNAYLIGKPLVLQDAGYDEVVTKYSASKEFLRYATPERHV